MALALTACVSTSEPSVTIVNNKPPTEAITKPVKPLPPKNGTPAELLRFGNVYGAYCQKLENKLEIIIEWVKSQHGSNRQEQ